MKKSTEFTVTGLYNENTYRTIKEFDGEIAFVFIPHQRKVSSTIFADENDMIYRAFLQTERSSSLAFQKFSFSELKSCFGDEIPPEAIEAMGERDYVYCINGAWESEASEADWAYSVMAYDLNSSYAFTDLAEAVAWIESYSKHQSGTANMSLAEELCRAGFTELVEE